MESKRISHYEIVRLLGRGGMGEVYEAVDLDLERRPVALKFIAPEMAADPESLKRFEREAISAAKLKHAHIATVHAFVRDTARPFIDMELVRGENLRERVLRGPLPVADAVMIARNVASALAHAHQRGVIHRDIKLENLMFDEDGAIKVMDFGLARAAQASRLTMTGSTLGTAGYMSPESLRGTPGAPADVFALGVVLYEMLAGALPFAGDSPLAMMYTIANEPHVPLRERRTDAPEALAALIDRMLSKDPALRPDALTVARELSALAGAPAPSMELVTEELEVEPLAGIAGSEAVAANQLPVPTARPARRPGRGPVAAIVLGLLVLSAGATSLLFLWPALRADAREEARALNNSGHSALEADSLEQAQHWFEAALKRDPDLVPARLNLGLTLRRRGDLDRAASMYSAVEARSGLPPAERAQALYGLADLDLDSGAYSEAVTRLREAAALDSTMLVYTGNLAFALIRAGRFPEAVAEGERAIVRFPNDPGLSKNLGYALVMSDRPADALPLLDRAVSQLEDPAPALGVRALAHAALGDRTRAASDWAAYVASDPEPREQNALLREYRARGGTP